MSLWLPQIVMFVTCADGHAGFLGQLRGGAVLVEPGHGEPAIRRDLGACDRAIRQLVLHGLATVKIRTFGPAASLIALPWPVKIGPLARIRSARVMPSLRGKPPTRITQSAPVKGFLGLVGRLDVGQERESAVVELHQGAVRATAVPG